MAEEPTQEIKRKWLLQLAGLGQLDAFIERTAGHSDITQHYLAQGALSTYLYVLRAATTRPVLYIDQVPRDWIEAVPTWAYHIGTGRDPGAVRLRSRKSGRGGITKSFLTIKSEGDPEPSPFEIELPEPIYACLGKLRAQGGPIVKRRYIQEHEMPGLEYVNLELDVFRGPHEGLVLLGAQFETTEDAEQFELPFSFEAFNPLDVTEDPRYGNLSLAVNGLPSD